LGKDCGVGGEGSRAREDRRGKRSSLPKHHTRFVMRDGGEIFKKDRQRASFSREKGVCRWKGAVGGGIPKSGYLGGSGKRKLKKKPPQTHVPLAERFQQRDMKARYDELK